MLKLIKTQAVDVTEAAIVEVQPEWVDSLAAALDRLVEGGTPGLPDLPDKLAASLVRVIGLLERRDQAELARAVEFSMQASEAMSAAARVTGDIRDVDTRGQAMSAAIEELNASIQQISTFAGQAAGELEDCVHVSHRGLEEVDQTTQKMRDIETAYQTIMARLERLEAASGEITQIVDSIEMIAGQTNLLALNATIEAARAGEAGRGFAVVAGEVKALSGQTEKATTDIRARIEALQGEVEGIVGAVHDSQSAVSGGLASSEQAHQSVEASVSGVGSSAGLVAEIARLMSEQSHATTELSSGVAGVAEGTSIASQRAESVIDPVAVSEGLVEDAFTALEARTIRDYVLYRAKSDHFLWKKKLSEMLVGRVAVDRASLPDHHACRLGKWYDAVGEEGLRSDVDFIALEAPHAEVHRNAQLAAERCEAGDRPGAQSAFEAMEAASAVVIDRLNALIDKRTPG